MRHALSLAWLSFLRALGVLGVFRALPALRLLGLTFGLAATSLGFYSVARADPKPSAGPIKRREIVACTHPDDVPAGILVWARVNGGPPTYSNGPLFLSSLSRFATLYVFKPDDPTCRTKPATAKPSVGPDGPPPMKVKAPPPAAAPKKADENKKDKKDEKPEAQDAPKSEDAPLTKKELADIEARSRRAQEARKKDLLSKAESPSPEDVTDAELEETERKPKPILKTLTRTEEATPITTSDCPGCRSDPMLQETSERVLRCRAPRALGSPTHGPGSKPAKLAVREPILKGLLAYKKATTETKKKAPREELRKLFEQIEDSTAEAFQTMLATQDALAVTFRGVLKGDPLQKELLGILEKKYTCAPTAPTAPIASSPDQQLPAEVRGVLLPPSALTDEAAFGLLDKELQQGLADIKDASNKLVRYHLMQIKQALQEGLIPALASRLARARQVKEAAFRESDPAKKAEAIKNAGARYTGAYLVMQVLKLHTDIALKTNWADEVGKDIGITGDDAASPLGKPLWDFRNDNAIVALMQAGLDAGLPAGPDAGVGTIAAALPAGSKSFKEHSARLDQWVTSVKHGAVMSKKVVLAADILSLAISIRQVAKTAVIPEGGPSTPLGIFGVAPGGALLGGAASPASVASVADAIKKLVAIGALDGAVIAGVTSLGGGSPIAPPEIQRPTSMAVQAPNQPGGSATSSGSGSPTPQTTSAAKEAVTFGENAESKLRSHWGDIQRLAKEHGVKMPGKFKEAGTQIRAFIDDVLRLGETKVGPYKPTGGGWSDARWTKHGNTIVIRSPDGKFVTILDAAGGGAALSYPGGL